MTLQELEELMKKDDEFYQRAHLLLRNKEKTLEEKLQDPYIRYLYKIVVKNETKKLEAIVAAEKLQEPAIKNSPAKLVQKEINRLIMFGTSNQWDGLPDSVKEQVKNQSKALLKSFNIQALTPVHENKFGLNNSTMGELIYERPRATAKAATELAESLLIDSNPINAPTMLGKIARIRLFTWQNYIGVVLYTDWGNYFGPPSNVLEYIEYLKDMALKVSEENENLHEKLEIEKEVEDEFNLKHKHEEKDELKEPKLDHKRKADGIENDSSDTADEENTTTPKPKLVKTRPY